MEKKINDYLHLYLGCEVMWENEEGTAGGTEILDGHLIESAKRISGTIHKPLLRPLSSMTEEEAIECAKILNNRPPHYGINEADVTRYQKSIDVVFTDNLDTVINIANNGDALVFRNEMNGKRSIEARPANQGKYFHYILSKHFDLFGLIESGLAINKKEE